MVLHIAFLDLIWFYILLSMKKKQKQEQENIISLFHSLIICAGADAEFQEI